MTLMKKERVSELDAEMARPGFWDLGDQAQTLLKERTRLQKIVEACEGAEQDLDDLELLTELGEEGEDQESLDEIRGLLPELETRIARMEFARMLSGEHDSCNAIFSVNAGAGGTEAQDWADILLRMYLRYCEKRVSKQR